MWVAVEARGIGSSEAGGAEGCEPLKMEDRNQTLRAVKSSGCSDFSGKGRDGGGLSGAVGGPSSGTRSSRSRFVGQVEK